MTAQWVPAWTRADGASRAAAAFRTAFRCEPDGVWSAPGRVNVIGEHTDYNAGLCLPIALPHRTYVALQSRPDGVVRLFSAQEPRAGIWEADLADVAPGAVHGWGAYVAGVAWAMREAGLEHVTGFDAVVDSCVPYGAGLSSSAALECAVAVALNDVHGLGLVADDAGRARLAELCVRAENEIAGAPTGGLDQTASLRCLPGHAMLLDFRDSTATPIGLDLAAFGLALLVVDTRAAHQHAGGQYAARRASCEEAAHLLGVPTLREVRALDAALDRLTELTAAEPEGAGDGAGEGAGGAGARHGDELRRRVRHVVTENARVEAVTALLAAGRVDDIGPVLTTAHASLRDDYEVSCPELDLAVAAAIAAGALGGRMVGGGFGGSAIALVRADDVEPVAQAVDAAFADAGLTAPAFLVATADGPAGHDLTAWPPGRLTA